jgi:ABC-type polysaccharide/polyol phosphate export permease
LNDPRQVIPEVRTTRRFAIAMSALALLALALALLFGDQLQDPLTSETAAVVVLVVWCVAGMAAAITAIVDAYIRPEGELLSLITSIAAAVFGVLALVVLIGIVVGATGVVDEESTVSRLRLPAEETGLAP